ncbi:MAG TPA: bifunctional D-glycero-beta-D-manno-heptose-7-phosphate kinase/D-glycero-beta-D-manno-heptose 1-phosphate adenylyltransferase HldE [Gammaproteobacteria bacterium]|nr:bifunctional D-glycero-beta-D-manno-heptose-7-phosphate kinase/D-glycero-beta-D-manno-heptose 1-phosphate adenylyltransferase HldE [Gammaproteobacteria bacterium]
MRVAVPDFSPARVLVAGDLMLDRYWHGATSRISPEAPVPVVHVRETHERPGGAGNVAVNITSLGASCTVFGVTGDDPAADTLAAALKAFGVACELERRQGVATITKLRVLSRHQQLIRLDFEERLDGDGKQAFRDAFTAALPRHDVVVLSDYAKGTLADPQALIRAARAAGRPVLVDPKGRDFTKYRGATVITPNTAEFETIVGPCGGEAELVTKGERLRAELGLEALLVTRGEHGMTLIRAAQPPLHLPAQAREVFDVTGAGDTVIALLAAGLAAGLDLPQAAALANLAAGIVVGKLGAASVTPAELRLAARRASEGDHRILDEAALLDAVAHARAQGERIVMTNGCFDILHAGHVSYLEEARALGDRLVVAVNDDESVRRLKGTARPINPLAHRMRVLAALACVDWVVPFAEDTPERLICRVLPDVLVKGGDYRPEEIAGHECVRRHGGEVRVLPFIEGVSTTDLIAAIRARGE